MSFQHTCLNLRCPRQGIPFQTRRSLAPYCSKPCSNAARAPQKRIAIQKALASDSEIQEAKETVLELLKQYSLTSSRLLKILDEGLSATKIISAVVLGKVASEKTNGFIEVPDWTTRHKFLETALALNPDLAALANEAKKKDSGSREDPHLEFIRRIRAMPRPGGVREDQVEPR